MEHCSQGQPMGRGKWVKGMGAGKGSNEILQGGRITAEKGDGAEGASRTNGAHAQLLHSSCACCSCCSRICGWHPPGPASQDDVLGSQVCQPCSHKGAEGSEAASDEGCAARAEEAMQLLEKS